MSGSQGIQRRPFRALARAFLIGELRAQGYGDSTGSKAGALVAPFTWVVAQLLTMSLLLSLSLFVRTPPGFFAAASLLLCAVSVFAAVAVEFHEAALDPADRTVLGWRPITARTYAAARGSTLAAYVLVVIACLTVLPASIGAGQWGAGPFWAPLYTLASVAVGLTAAAAVLVLHLALGAGPLLDALRTGLAWLQIVGVMVGLYGGQLMLRDDTGNLEMLGYAPPPWFVALPSTALGEAVAAGSRAPMDALGPLGVAWASAAAATLLGGGLLARAWARLRDPGQATSVHHGGPVRGTLAAGAGRVLGAWMGRQGYAAFWLASAALRRDRELLSRSLPALATGAAAVVMGLLTGQYGDPLAPETPWADRALPVATVALLVSAVPSLLHNALYSRDHAAAWRLRAAPLAAPSALAHGLRRAMLLWVVYPSVMAVGAVSLLRWDDPAHALAWTLGTGALVELCSRLLLPAVVRDVPFSRPAARGVALGPIAIPIAGAASLASVVAGLASLAAGRPWLLLLGFIALVLASPLASRRADPQLDARLAGARS